MTEQYVSKYFNIRELVPLETANKFGNDAFQFLSVNALKTLDRVREVYDSPLLVNTYIWNSSLGAEYRGFRPYNCKIGAKYSQHRLGNAFDVVIPDREDFGGNILRSMIMDNLDEFPLLTAMEQGTPHLHFDCRNISTKTGIFIFKP